jgi:hypothetical protein
MLDRSGAADGNPSYAMWRWEVAEAANGTEAGVSWDLQPVTRWRRHLLAKVHARQLRQMEVQASLFQIAGIAASRA